MSAGSAGASDRHGAVATDAGAVRQPLERPRAAPRRARPAPLPVGHDDLFAVAQPQDASQVVGVLVGEHRVARVRHEDLAGRRRPHGDGGVGGPALAKGGAQAREHALAAPRSGGGHLLAA